MKLTTLIILFFIISMRISVAQIPETDIFIAQIKNTQNGLQFSGLQNITNRNGYDNQPFFTPDGKDLLFVSIADTTQSDIYAYSIANKKTRQITHSNESEYSPTIDVNKKWYTVVRVDADSGQRLYQLSVKNPDEKVLISNTDSIGYYCRLNDTSIAMFILGKANTLQVLNTKTGKRTLIASDIGRCFKLNKAADKLFFILKSNESEWFIYTMDCKSYKTERFAPTLPGSEDYTLLPDDRLLMGKEAQLYLWEKDKWNVIADFSAYVAGFYRIAVNNDGTLLALVVLTLPRK